MVNKAPALSRLAARIQAASRSALAYTALGAILFISALRPPVTPPAAAAAVYGATIPYSEADRHCAVQAAYFEAGTDPEETRVNQIHDRVNTLGMTWLGATLECCQCHDHKYDPFTMRDFYSLGAFFADIQESVIGKREDGIVIIAEVLSRFEDVNAFVKHMREEVGFKTLTVTKMKEFFYMMVFRKERTAKGLKRSAEFCQQLKPCLYKKR